MAWHVFNAEVLSNDNEHATIHLTNHSVEPFEVHGIMQAKGALISVRVQKTVTDSNEELYTSPNDVLYLDPESGKASYNSSALLQDRRPKDMTML